MKTQRKHKIPFSRTVSGSWDYFDFVPLENVRKALETYTKRITRSPEAARAALVKEGIFTKTGRLAKRYR